MKINKSFFDRIWGLDKNISHIDDHRLTNRYSPEPNCLPKSRKLKNWNWKQNFKSIEDATEFLLNYSTELGPLAEECLRRLNKNEETISQLTIINKQLRRGIINEKSYQRRKTF